MNIIRGNPLDNAALWHDMWEAAMRGCSPTALRRAVELAERNNIPIPVDVELKLITNGFYIF